MLSVCDLSVGHAQPYSLRVDILPLCPVLGPKNGHVPPAVRSARCARGTCPVLATCPGDMPSSGDVPVGTCPVLVMAMDMLPLCPVLGAKSGHVAPVVRSARCPGEVMAMDMLPRCPVLGAKSGHVPPVVRSARCARGTCPVLAKCQGDMSSSGEVPGGHAQPCSLRVDILPRCPLLGANNGHVPPGEARRMGMSRGGAGPSPTGSAAQCWAVQPATAQRLPERCRRPGRRPWGSRTRRRASRPPGRPGLPS